MYLSPQLRTDPPEPGRWTAPRRSRWLRTTPRFRCPWRAAGHARRPGPHPGPADQLVQRTLGVLGQHQVLEVRPAAGPGRRAAIRLTPAPPEPPTRSKPSGASVEAPGQLQGQRDTGAGRCPQPAQQPGRHAEVGVEVSPRRDHSSRPSTGSRPKTSLRRVGRSCSPRPGRGCPRPGRPTV